MDPVAIARWQFGVTTVYHFLFVPITIAMSMLVAVIQTIWVRTGKERYLRLTKFFGKLFLINFALGVVTGIVQEFQFGMNWSEYSRFVGDVFNTELNRAELDGVGGFLEVLGNPLLMSALPHVIFASYMVAGGLVAGISAWHLAKPDVSEEDAGAYRWATKFGAWVLIAGSALTFYTGDAQAKAITQLQPSKIAAAEGAFEDTGDFSLLTIPNADQTGTIVEIKIPLVLSFIAGVPQIKGIDTIREQYTEHGYSLQNGSQTNIQGEYAQQLAEKYGHIDPIPNVNATYWSFRMMMAFGGLGLLIGVYVLWVIRGGRTPKASKLWTTLMAAMPLLPLFGISFGWIFTEMGRQPWLVAGVMPTQAGISPTVSAGEVLLSLIVYTLLYGLLAVIEVGLFFHYTAKGLPKVAEPKVSEDPDAPMSFA